jgi:hypothetical protein
MLGIFPAIGLRCIGGIYSILIALLGLTPSSKRKFGYYQGIASLLAG